MCIQLLKKKKKKTLNEEKLLASLNFHKMFHWLSLSFHFNDNWNGPLKKERKKCLKIGKISSIRNEGGALVFCRIFSTKVESSSQYGRVPRRVRMFGGMLLVRVSCKKIWKKLQNSEQQRNKRELCDELVDSKILVLEDDPYPWCKRETLYFLAHWEMPMNLNCFTLIVWEARFIT